MLQNLKESPNIIICFIMPPLTTNIRSLRKGSRQYSACIFFLPSCFSRFLPPLLYPLKPPWHDLMKKLCKSSEKYINLLCKDKLLR